MKVIRQQPNLAFIVTWIFIALAIIAPKLLAQLASPINYNPPTGGDAPTDDKKAGGDRPGCPKVAKPLTALNPKYYIGFTVADRPTFWVYVPYSLTKQDSATFTLWDAQQQTKVYETTFPLTNIPGIVSFRLPENAPPLAIGKIYRWDFSFKGGDGCQDLITKLWLKRITLSDAVKSQLNAATTPRERIVIYAANGLWHEAITDLAELRRKSPNDEALKTDWSNLLRDRDVRLEQIVSEPISSCCNSNR